MKKYTLVDQDTCIACNACGAIVPAIFEYDDDGLSFSILDDNKGITPIAEELADDFMEAYEGCPTESIKLANEPFACVAVRN